MIPATYCDLVGLLARRSAEGAVAWRGTNTAGRYSVHLGEVTYELEDAFDEDGEAFLLFRVRGERGRTIDVFSIDQSDSDWGSMSDLYEGARRTVTRVDSVMALLNDATPDSPVGGEPISQDDSDIPF